MTKVGSVRMLSIFVRCTCCLLVSLICWSGCVLEQPAEPSAVRPPALPSAPTNSPEGQDEGLGSIDCSQDNACPCPETLGRTQECYDGAMDTVGVGACQPGTRYCTVDGWSACEGQVRPQDELCEVNEVDEDCNGIADDIGDFDGDGWNRCTGDCCESVLGGCGHSPELVNPGAYDILGDGLDNDCDGHVDNANAGDCDTAPGMLNVDANDLVEGLDLCHFVSENSGAWGVIDAQLSRADGSGAPDSMQYAVLEHFGSRRSEAGDQIGIIVPPGDNDTMVVLSTGRARSVGDVGFDPYDLSYSGCSWWGDCVVPAPERYVQNSGVLSSHDNCPHANSTGVRDSVRLRIKMRVPSNVQGFRYQFRFFTYEYPTWVCTEFNDFFLGILESEHVSIPLNGNISFDGHGNPISVNSAFFTACDPIRCGALPGPGPDSDDDGCVDSLSCDAEGQWCESQWGACPNGTDGLESIIDADVYGSRHAGATAWLLTEAPVVPGEVMTLDLHIWDTSDSLYDSSVLLDGFQWLTYEPTIRTIFKQ